jgi:HlyD family secretion protein
VKRWIFIGGGVVLLAVIVVANLVKDSTPSVGAKTSPVERRNLTARITAPGKLKAVSSVDISAEVPGRVVQLDVAEGDSVTAGQLLLRLDDDQYRSRVEQTEASLASAKANLALSEARLEKTKNDKERLEALHSRDLASEQDLETAVTDYRVQQADVEARRQEVARNEAALLDARDNLDKTVYRAPVSGIVSRLNIEKGEIVMTGTMNNPGTVILTIADLGSMEVEADVDETDVVDVKVGQKAKVTVDALPDTSFAGRVASVGNAGRVGGQGTTDQVINFEVKVRLDSTDPRLKPGMTADIDVATDTRDSVLTVPIQALVARSRSTLHKDLEAALGGKNKRRSKASADTVWAAPDSLKGPDRDKWEKEVVEGVYKVVDGKAVFVPVIAGITGETMIQVSGDLAPGDRVVSGPYKVLRELKEGTKIKAPKSKKGEDAGES